MSSPLATVCRSGAENTQQNQQRHDDGDKGLAGNQPRRERNHVGPMGLAISPPPEPVDDTPEKHDEDHGGGTSMPMPTAVGEGIQATCRLSRTAKITPMSEAMTRAVTAPGGRALTPCERISAKPAHFREIGEESQHVRPRCCMCCAVTGTSMTRRRPRLAWRSTASW
jgi:hypothetical protein